MSMPCTSCLNPLFRGLHRVAWNCATTVADHGREYSTGKGKETLGQKFLNRQKKTYQLHHSRSSFVLPLVVSSSTSSKKLMQKDGYWNLWKPACCCFHSHALFNEKTSFVWSIQD